MKNLLSIIFLLFSVSLGYAHEMTPTYPKPTPSYIKDIFEVKMNLYNAREDVQYYEINVFDDQWNPVPFAANKRIVKLPFKQRMSFSVYLRKSDINRATYICTLSRLRKEDVNQSAIASRICSKIKRD